MAVGTDVVSDSGNSVNETGAFAEVWNGTSWELAEPVNPAGSALVSVSCAASNFCVAVGTYGGEQNSPLMETWNGSAWTQVEAPLPQDTEFGDESLAGVSCPAVTSCTVVGSYESSTYNTQIPVSDVWDGTTWSIVPMSLPSPATDLYANMETVSCFAALSCRAIGTNHSGGVDGFVEAETTSGWKIESLPSDLAEEQLWDVSCPSANFCAVVPNEIEPNEPGELGLWNGSTWSSAPIPESVNEVPPALSCIPSGSCVLAAGDNTVEDWNGNTWTSVATAGPPAVAYNQQGISAISCLKGGACMAVATEDVLNPADTTGPGDVHAGYAFAELGPIAPS
jgi:hypothetical protein